MFAALVLMFGNFRGLKLSVLCCAEAEKITTVGDAVVMIETLLKEES